jgi:two-component system sensor histidine kinase HydH
MGRIDALVTRMLKFAGPAKPVFSEVRLHEVLDHSLRLVQPQLEGKTIASSRSFQAVPDLVRGDDCQLQQAFVNLFLNALEAMGPNGTLSVATEIVLSDARSAGAGDAAGQPRLRVTVKDDGPGIPPGDLARLFEPFFTTKPNGTGLGLPITRRIILEHQGTITVESQPGRGTAFHILLPASA